MPWSIIIFINFKLVYTYLHVFFEFVQLNMDDEYEYMDIDEEENSNQVCWNKKKAN